MRPSMGSVGDAYDNAMAESFFASLECELIARASRKTKTEARLAVFTWIESLHNPRRRHSRLNYLSPLSFERKHEIQMTQLFLHEHGLSTGYCAAVESKLLAFDRCSVLSTDSPGGYLIINPLLQEAKNGPWKRVKPISLSMKVTFWIKSGAFD